MTRIGMIGGFQLAYQTVLMKLTKKKQREIAESSPAARLHLILDRPVV